MSKVKHKRNISSVLLQFLVAVIFIGTGILMLVRNLVAGGVYSRINQITGFDGWFLLLFGLIFLVVAYFSLSPFSATREFFEGSRRREKETKKSHRQKVHNYTNKGRKLSTEEIQKLRNGNK